MAVEERDTLIEFPCDFDIKAMGLSGTTFETTVLSIVNEYVDDIKEGAITVYVESQTQLDAIYQALSGNDLVNYVL
jgi:putative lipoic acid-binding regulatory protein